jgi:biopolymer transport protein ExbD
MRIPKTAKKKARIEIIPMIDTMFFLLVFFMVATLSMSVQRGLPVNLPHATTAREDITKTVTITITKDGRLFWDKEAIHSVGECRLRLERISPSPQKTSVIINADRETLHGKVVEVMDMMRDCGITKMAISTKPGREKG